MAFGRVLVGFVAVLLLFAAWSEAGRRLGGGQAVPLRAVLLPAAVEASLLSLFAALWFGSLGSGGAWLLFPLVGLLMEVPARLRHGGPLPWKPIAGGVLRVLLAGLLLGVVMT